MRFAVPLDLRGVLDLPSVDPRARARGVPPHRCCAVDTTPGARGRMRFTPPTRAHEVHDADVRGRAESLARGLLADSR
jgi:hypothetical protein